MSSVQEKTKIKEIFSTLVDGNDLKNSENVKEQKETEKTSNVSCNSQSKDLFLERVRTFTTMNWAAKPNELSPLRCAQYGWCNEEPDQLRCVTCSAIIFAGIPDDWDSNAYSEICNKIKNELKIGHEKLCPWPHNPCPPSFLSLPSLSVLQWKNELKSSFTGLLELKGNLPELNEDVVAAMKSMDNSCIEELLKTVFRFHCETDDEGLQAKVACILTICGWKASQPIVEDPSITCSLCGKEAGLWHYKLLSNRSSRNSKHHKGNFESIAASQQSLSEDFMSSRVSVKSEKSDHSTHSGSVTHELSKLATSSDSLAHSDLLKPASSQESLINLRVSDSKHMSIDHDHYDDSILGHDTSHSSHSVSKQSLFTEPRIPLATPQELMKELLLSTAPGGRSHSIYSDSIFSEVGSECFEKRLEDTTEKDLELEKAITENPPSSHPNHVQQQWMKELLFMTADNNTVEATESVMSEIGSVSFDRRIDGHSHSTAHTPRVMTPVHTTEEDDGEPVRNKRMRFQEPYDEAFNMIDEHRHWCPWINSNTPSPTATPVTSTTTTTTTEEHGTTSRGQTSITPEKTPSKLFASKTSVPGWKVILTLLLPSIGRDVNSPSSPPPLPNEAWKSVRTVLGDCISTSPYVYSTTST